MAFFNCTSLKEIELPESVNYLGPLSFYGCTVLEAVNIPSECEINSPNDDAYQFEGCISLVKVTVSEHNSYYTLSDGILYNKQGDFLIKSFSNGNKIIIPNRVITIGARAFAYSKCETVLMPDNVTKIGDMAFFNCLNLKYLRFSRNVSEISVDHEGSYGKLFDNCKNLSKISNLSFETLQRFPEVFKSIPNATINLETESKDELSENDFKDIEKVIPQDVLEAIDSKYFKDPQKTKNRIKEILKYQDESIVKRDNPYLNQVRKILEDVRNSLQDIGLIPFEMYGPKHRFEHFAKKLAGCNHTK